jgi:apolipoprotein N-acyltransferase
MVQSVSPRVGARAAGESADVGSAARRRALPPWHYLIALAAGAANTLSFAPSRHGGWLELALLALVYVLLARSPDTKRAAATGAAFGFGNFVTGVWWLYVSMHDYGDMAAPLALAALVLFSLYLALYPALSAALWSRCTGRTNTGTGAAAPWYRALVFASAWAVGEWLRGTVFTGFPWLASGYAQVDGPLAGYAALIGVYGIGWLAALVAALGVETARVAFARRKPGLCVALPGLAAAALLALGLPLARIAWTAPAHTPLDIRILQGNIKQEMKWDEAGLRDAIALYQRQITERPADLIVTPETAVPLLLQQMPDSFGLAVRAFADTTHSSILLGALGATIGTDSRVTDVTNSLFGVTPGVPGVYRYDKHHLVPFGEFVPWGFHWFVQLMNIPLGDQASGAAVQPPFVVRGQAVAPDICYEDIFGEEIARSLRQSAAPAGILVNTSNLGWFGDTIALEQHLQMARMRTLEVGRPLVAATNTGITAAIDARGRVLARLPRFTAGALDVKVQGMAGATPYMTLGNVPVLAVSLLVLVLGYGVARRRRGRR